MSPTPRTVLAWLALVLALVAAPSQRAAAGDDDEDKPTEREPKCTCAVRNACWHYLHAPVEPTDEPCWCPLCTPDHHHDGTHVPEGWNATCFQSKSLECFLRRHAASWKITCSECLAETKCCDQKHQERCPACGEGDAKDPFKTDCFGKDARASAAERLAIESKFNWKHAPVVAYSRHFYVVTDLMHVQVRVQSGGFRYVDAHEYAHIMLERAEKAYRQFDEAFDGRIALLRPMAVILPKSETTAAAVREAYFRNKNAPMIYSSYAGAGESAIAQGFCLNGLCVSPQQAGGDDFGLHQSMRHLIGNILVTCWVKRNGENKTMPRWAFEGVAHWLGRSQKNLGDEGWYCIGEDKKVSGSTKHWMADLVDMAAKNQFGPIDELFSKSDLGHLTYQDHKRAWGIFEICMAEWRGPFVAMLADLRRETNVREAFENNLKCTPEEFQQRWIDRLLGLRKTITSPRYDKPDPNVGKLALDPGDSTESIVSKLHALDVVSDPAMVKQIVDLVGRTESEMVRETSLAVLRKVKDAACLRAVWEYGLAHAEKAARTYCARLCRNLRLADARDALRKQLGDSWWMARCEAALALGALKDVDSQEKLREMVEDSSPKVRIAAMDALLEYGDVANDACVPVIAKNLAHPYWQVRLAACQDLRRLGSYLAVDALVARFQIETGRVAEEILRTLKSLTNEDLGLKPASWSKWWEREGGYVKEHHGFDPKPKIDPNSRYGNQDLPKYYGVELYSQRIGFVLDVSRSTNRLFNPDESTRGLLHRSYEHATIFQIAAEEVALSVKSLDPRAYFNVIAFGTDVRKWQRTMVAATPSNKDGAGNFVHSYEANGETNFYAAMLAALDADADALASPDLHETLDTMVFLTDGTPTKGEICDPAILVEWYREMNRYFRVRTDVFAFGRLEVDVVLLTKLAEQNEGRFTQLFEEN